MVGFWSTLGCGLGPTFDPDPSPGLNTVAVQIDKPTKGRPRVLVCCWMLR